MRTYHFANTQEVVGRVEMHLTKGERSNGSVIVIAVVGVSAVVDESLQIWQIAGIRTAVLH